MIVGLTGGIASGKTLVTDALSHHGVQIIDADIIAREIVEPGKPALKQLADVFGWDILDSVGRLKRKELRLRAFADDVSRQKLNNIMHPAIRAEILSQLAKPRGNEEAYYRILSIPLLLENNWQHLVDMVVVVDVDEKMQLIRAIARDQNDREAVLRIMKGQYSRKERLKYAHGVIDNHGSVATTLKQVTLLHKQIMALICR